jgi:two-component system response regulator AtoC
MSSWHDDPTKPPAARGGEAIGPLPQVALVIYHRGEASIVPLVPHARIVIGRAKEADISVPEPTLSRQHAQVEVIGHDAYIEDLDSSDGTWVNGKPTIRCKLRPGDDVALGSVTLSLHTTANYARGIEHHSRFLVALEEELTRSRIFGHQLALVLVAPGDEESEQQRFSAWCSHLRQVLRPVDRVALQAPTVLEVLMPEAGLQEARTRVERLREALPGVRVALATYPGAADSAAGLLEACLAGLERATPHRPVELRGSGESAAAQSPVTPAVRVWGDAMQSVYQTVLRVARSDLPVLICGETGTGKEVVARAIHEAGPRRKPAALLQLRRHRPRADREHALRPRAGRLHRRQPAPAEASSRRPTAGPCCSTRSASCPPAQVALLRVLETGRVHAGGRQQELPVDVRVIAATHRDLEADVRRGQLPLGPLLPAQHDHAQGPAAARAPRRDRAAGAQLHRRASRMSGQQPREGGRARRPRAAAALPLAGQRPRAAQRDRAGGARLSR